MDSAVLASSGKEPAATYFRSPPYGRNSLCFLGPRRTLFAGPSARGHVPAFAGLTPARQGRYKLTVSTRTTSKRREFLPATPVRGSTNGRCRTCAGRRADVRTTCNGCAGVWRTWASCSPWRHSMSLPSFPFPIALGSLENLVRESTWFPYPISARCWQNWVFSSGRELRGSQPNPVYAPC